MSKLQPITSLYRTYFCYDKFFKAIKKKQIIMQLKDKIAVVYGATGAIGTAVAKAFAEQGAKVFLTGRKQDALSKLLQEIKTNNGRAETAVIDALDEKAVNEYVESIVQREGRIDISFNAIGIPQTGVQGIPLVQLSPEDFMNPVINYTRSHFITAKAAALNMVAHKSGVIIMLTATPSKAAAPLTGGMTPSWAALEAMTRAFATELGSSGIRVVCLRSDGMPETDTITEVFELHAKGAGMGSHKDFQDLMENMTMLKRLPKLSELANTAAFIASDNASAITGTTINISCGSVAD
jgi:NAD(P)-dependent dehydrogenase (short-subunit alcohol dehydrogenase family)